jgi:hypothetical protein
MQTATSSSNRPFYRNRWWTPAVSVFLGLLMLGAFWIGDEPGQGVISLGIMTGLGALFYFGGRSETLRALGGPGRDERWASIDVRATAAAGSVLVAVIIGAFLVEVATGGDGSPYAALGAVGGLAYVIAVAVLRARS